uniref:Lipid-binding serum glycoprotein C-terminal domain-containing protein n=1 Tax=Euplotes harpa TaxID=151035 RepID=A0A7S3N9Q4_9SPIT|mmetsp:Transcript_37826/g.43461  ORF Transcript_37826/g.43461 Transcript_37826/m.43461 type:complete len:348 (+) Transcript_37826:698-1741(+)
MTQPVFTDRSLALVLKGEVTSKAEEVIPFVEKRKINYEQDKSAKNVQLSVSDYFLNTTLYSAYNLDMIKGNITSFSGNDTSDPITASMFKLIWPKITDHMPADQKLVIIAKSVKDFTPYLEITEGMTMIKLIMTLSFAQLDGQGVATSFIDFKANVTIQADLEVTTPFKFLTDIQQMKIKATELIADKYSLTNLADLNSIIGTISGLIRNYMNKVFSGYRPGYIDLGFLKIDYNNTRLMEKEHYYYFDSSPTFITKVGAKTVVDPAKAFCGKPVTYQEKVDAVAKLIKLTPIYQGLKDLSKNQDVLMRINKLAPFGGQAFGGEADDGNMPKERDEQYESQHAEGFIE